MTLGGRFTSGPNALNFIRLCLACEVTCWHAYALPRGGAGDGLFSDVGVDGFFAISGFLIVRSWERSTPTRYLLARARRIMPGLVVCLLVTAFLFAPLVGSPRLGSQVAYVVSGLRFGHQWGIAGSLATWNGSLWSLRYEVACYAAVWLLGLTRLLRPIVVAGLTFTCWAVVTLLAFSNLTPQLTPWWLSPRCALMFGIGALLWMHRDRVRLDWQIAAACAVVLAASATLPDYRIVGGPALAYLCLYAGVTLGRSPRLRLRNDLSYGAYIYAFPVQQLLIAAGLVVWWPLFALASIASVAPFAAASWFLVERRLVTRRARTDPRCSEQLVRS